MREIKDSLRILSFNGDGTAVPYIIEDLNDALREQGHQVLCLQFKVGQSIMEWFNQIKQFNPHFAFFSGVCGILDVSYQGTKTNLLDFLGIPYACLFFDNPWLQMSDLEKAYSDLTNVFVLDKVYLDELKVAGISRAYYLPLGTNPSNWLIESSDDQAKFACEIALVGTLANRENLYKMRKELAFGSLIKLMLNMRREAPAISNEQTIENICKSLDNPDEIDFLKKLPHTGKYSDITWLIDGELFREKRIHYVRELQEMGLQVFGNEEWLKILRNPNAYKGTIDYRKELPLLYKNAKINVDIPHPQLVNSANQRVYDVPAAGGFVLTEDKPAIRELFEIDKEIVCYKNMADLKAKIGYFLEHEKERRAIAEAGQRKVLNEHTWAKRAQTIVEVMTQNYGASGFRISRQSKVIKKLHDYRGAFNPNLVNLIPKDCCKILDVGCADGVFGRFLLDKKLADEVVGIEINPETAAAAATRLTVVHCADVETLELSYAEGHFDCIVYGDSLEHLKDPESLLRRHLKSLKPGGSVVCSIPNIRNLFIIDHLLHGNWTYTRWGILDRTHLRFFTLKEIIKMFQRLGLKVDRVEPSLRDGAWFTKMYGGEQVNQEFIREYDELLRKCLNGDDITGELKNRYRFHTLTQQEAIEFFTAQFHMRVSRN